MLNIWCPEQVLCVVVYCPPHQNPDFLPEFSDMTFIVLSYDKLTIAGDFYIHAVDS